MHTHPLWLYLTILCMEGLQCSSLVSINMLPRACQYYILAPVLLVLPRLEDTRLAPHRVEVLLDLQLVNNGIFHDALQTFIVNITSKCCGFLFQKVQMLVFLLEVAAQILVLMLP